MRGMAHSDPLAWVAGRVRAEERGLCIVGRRVRSVVSPRRMAYKPSDPDRSAERRDRTDVRAHEKEEDPLLDRSRGGFRFQIPRLADRRGRPLRLRVTGGPGTGSMALRARPTCPSGVGA